MDALKKGLVAVQVGEALANYAVADAPLKVAAPTERTRRPEHCDWIFQDDQTFWQEQLSDYGKAAREKTRKPQWFRINFAAVSEWVARVPGLYWLPGSARMRKVHPSQIESEDARWRTYTPKGKSQLVSGGVGTLRFPPSEDGYRLVTLSASCNASTGVPALVSPDVWDYLDLKEGSIIVDGWACWRAMPQRWAVQFPIIQEIPRDCLILDNVEAIGEVEQRAPIQAHPFSVLEYWDGPTQLHDFVYATAYTGEKRFRHEISEFFETYRKARDRDGSYLIAADIEQPMWEAIFASPAEMRKDKDAQLRLIEERVQDVVKGVDVVEALVRKLSGVMDETDLKRLSVKAGIEWRRWSRGGSIGEQAARLVDAAIRSSKQQALLYAIQFEVPQ